jgi:hypothetical protein
VSTGESILHIVIVHRNSEEARWLLDFYRNHQYSVPGGIQALLHSNATGSLFEPKKSLYFGGYPIHFAVCSNDVNIFDLVLSFASAVVVSKAKLDQISRHHEDVPVSAKAPMAQSQNRYPPNSLLMSLRSFRGNFATEDSSHRSNDTNPKHLGSVYDLLGLPGMHSIAFRPPPCDRELYRCDNYGNNVLHFCVIHGLKEMYMHIRQTAARLIRRELKVAVINFRKAAIGKSSFKLDPAFRTGDSLYCYPPRETDITFDNFGVDDMDSIPETWFERMVHKKVDERLNYVLNCAFHSPITFAADVTPANCKTFNMKPDVEMLKLLLDEQFTSNWQYGPTHSSMIKIVGLEKPYLKKNYEVRPIPPEATMFGVIEWITRSRFEQASTIPVISQLIQNKWKVIGKPTFMRRLSLHVVFTIFMTMIAYYPYRVPFVSATVAEHNPTDIYANRLVAISFVCNVVICCYNLWTDAPYLLTLGLDWWGFYGGVRGAARIDRFLRTAMVFSFIFIIILKGAIWNEGMSQTDQYQIGGSSADDSQTQHDIHALERTSLAMVSICVGVCWLYFFYFFLGYKELAPFLLIIYRIVCNDFTYFFQFYGIVLVAISVPCAVLTNDGSRTPYYGLYRSLLAMWELLQDTVSMNASDQFTVLQREAADSHLEWLVDFYVTAFYVIVCLLFVNLLIGMIGSTYSAFIENPMGLVLLEQYNILSSIEQTSSSDEQRRLLLKYATPTASLDRYDAPVSFAVVSSRKSRAASVPEDNAALAVELDDNEEDDIIYEFEFEVFDDNWKHQPTTSKKDERFVCIFRMLYCF